VDKRDLLETLETLLIIKKAKTKGTTGWSPVNDPRYHLVNGRYQKVDNSQGTATGTTSGIDNQLSTSSTASIADKVPILSADIKANAPKGFDMSREPTGQVHRAGVLLLDRKTGKLVMGNPTGTDQFDAFKGGVEQGEDPRTAALRELREETGLDIGADKIAYIDTIDLYGQRLALYGMVADVDLDKLYCESLIDQGANQGKPEMQGYKLIDIKSPGNDRLFRQLYKGISGSTEIDRFLSVDRDEGGSPAIAPKDPKRKYVIGDQISKPDGSIWQKISPFNWKQVSGPNSAPIQIVPRPSDSLPIEDKDVLQSALDKIKDPMGVSAVYKLKKDEFAQLCLAYGVKPQDSSQQAKIEAFKQIGKLIKKERDEASKKDLIENTVKLPKLKVYGNPDFQIEIDSKEKVIDDTFNADEITIDGEKQDIFFSNAMLSYMYDRLDQSPESMVPYLSEQFLTHDGINSKRMLSEDVREAIKKDPDILIQPIKGMIENLKEKKEPFDLMKAGKFEKLEENARPMRGRHWGSAKSDNTMAKAVAFSSGTAFKPIDFMKDGKLQRHSMVIDRNTVEMGIRLRKYAQERMKGKEMSRASIPVFYRGQTLPKEAIDALLSGESDTIELTGCTAMTCYESVMSKYACSQWTQSFGQDKIPVKLHIARTDELDDSIGMFHPHSAEMWNGSLKKPFFEALSGAEALRVVKIDKPKESNLTRQERWMKKTSALYKAQSTKWRKYHKIDTDWKYVTEPLEKDTADVNDYLYEMYQGKEGAAITKHHSELMKSLKMRLDSNSVLGILFRYFYLNSSVAGNHYSILEDAQTKLKEQISNTKREIKDDESVSSDKRKDYEAFLDKLEEKAAYAYDKLKFIPPMKASNFFFNYDGVLFHTEKARRFAKAKDFNELSKDDVYKYEREKNTFEKSDKNVLVLHCVVGRGKKSVSGGDIDMTEEEQESIQKSVLTEIRRNRWRKVMKSL
jgi:8-oxo-dGTP pyrophosphatase MutT (NUDIX family)